MNEIGLSIFNHVKEHKFVFILLLLTTISGSLGECFYNHNMLRIWFKISPWKNWENASVISTLIFAIGYYLDLYLEDYFVVLSRKRLLVASSSLFFIAILSVFSTRDFSRPIYMSLLFIISVLYCTIDIALRTGDLENSFKNILQLSDIPVSIAFFILFLYSIFMSCLNPEGLCEMDPFFGGAVAFQMILSNVIWTFTDKPKSKKAEVVINN